MVKIIKKINLSVVIILLCVLALAPNVFVRANESKNADLKISYDLDPTSNFFTQKEDTRTIEIIDKRDQLLIEGYTKVSENDEAILYFKKKTCGIAVFDKVNNYTWYSTYQNIDPNSTPEVIAKIESGISIEYYNVDSKGTIKSTELSYTGKDTLAGTGTNGSCEQRIVDNGIDIDVKFKSYGLSLTIEVRLEGNKIKVNVPSESIKEEVIVKKIGTRETVRDFKFRSITLFPYFGSENYEINGYSFIPDGSGALIRYTDNVTSTAYIKKLYGNDYSFSEYSTNEYIVDNGSLGLPIYGVNHGYNQAAFLCEATSGLGSMELHSYPYSYSLIPINTTFFRYIVRDRFNVKLSQNTMNLLNDEPYNTDYTFTYTLLRGDKANYVGMAECYRESLGLTDKETNINDIPLRLELLGIDYKPGLFGKSYVKMTRYSDALDIIKDLESEEIKNFSLTYLGWNRGGYFTNNATTARTALLLGGKRKLTTLQDYLNEKGYAIDYTINPVIATGIGDSIVKKVGLSPFEVTLKSSLEQTGYYLLPTKISEVITDRASRYKNLGIDSFKVDNLNAAYSYRYKSEATYRSDMINQIVEEMKSLTNYRISLEKPNSYLLPYVDNYYDAYYESNKFIYETDSVPFMSILLGGAITQYMPNINYVSDYELAVLRMIEYNLYPSFLITKEEAYDLRYTNFEYLNSTQYSLWKDLMVAIYEETNNALKSVANARLVDHRCIDTGISKCVYSNGVIIYINYNKDAKDIDGISLAPYSYQVKGGN